MEGDLLHCLFDVTGRIGEKLSFQSDYAAIEVEMAQRESAVLQMTANNLKKSLLRCYGGFATTTTAADDGLSGWRDGKVKCARGRTKRPIGKFLIPGIP